MALTPAKYKVVRNDEWVLHDFKNLLLAGTNHLKKRDLRIATPDKGVDVPVNGANVPANVPVKRKDEIIKQLLINPSLTADDLASQFFVTDKKQSNAIFPRLKV